MNNNERYMFRVWDEEVQEMLYPETEEEAVEIGYKGDLIGIDKEGCWTGGLNCVLMQCLGKHDKNGKLIYEEDILKDNKGNIGKIFYDKKECAYKVLWLTTENEYFIDNCIGYGEVIGNKFENKELWN